MGFLKRFFKSVLATAVLMGSMTFGIAQTGVAPNVRFLETDQALPDGLWRIRLDGDVFSIQKNTNASNNFATAIDAITIAANGDVTIPNDFFVTGSATVTVDTSITGQLIIGTDNAEALLVRNAGDTIDVFTVDTTNDEVELAITTPLQWGTTTKLFRGENAWELELRDGTNSNYFFIYDTFTDYSNYERLRIGSGGGGEEFFINAETAGTGEDSLELIFTVAGGAGAMRFRLDGQELEYSPGIFNFSGAGTTSIAGVLGLTVDRVINLGRLTTSTIDALIIDAADLVAPGQQDSHALIMTGLAHDGSAHDADWKIFVDVTSNAGASVWTIQERVDAASFVTTMVLNGGSQLSLPQTAAFISLGSTPAQDGDIRLRNGGGVQWRNQADDDDLAGIFVDSSDILQFAFDASITTVNTEADLTVEGLVRIDDDNTEAFLVRADGDGGDVFNVDTTNDAVELGSTTELDWGGDVKLFRDGPWELALRDGNNDNFFYVYAEHTDDMNFERLAIYAGGDGEQFIEAQTLGTGTNTVNLSLISAAAGSSIQLRQGGTNIYTFAANGIFTNSATGTLDFGSLNNSWRDGNFGRSVNIGHVQTSPLFAIIIDMANLAAPGQTDSHDFMMTGVSHDGAPHDADWITHVDVTSNAGASTWVLENRLDAALATMLTITDAGDATLTGDVSLGIGKTGTYDAITIDQIDRTTNGEDDSGKILLTGVAYDGSAHDADWQMFVDVTGQAAPSTWTLQSRIDAAGFANQLIIADTGNMTVSGDINGTATESFVISNVTSVAGVPVFIPTDDDLTAGIGGESGEVSIITNSTDRLVVGTGAITGFIPFVRFNNTGGTLDGVTLEGTLLVAPGQQDSDAIILTGLSHDGAPHEADWKTFVDVQTNAGASTWRLQSRIDAAGFANMITVIDTGELAVFGDLIGNGAGFFQGRIRVDADDDEALHIRKNSDTGDVFSVDTNNSRVLVGAVGLDGLDNTPPEDFTVLGGDLEIVDPNNLALESLNDGDFSSFANWSDSDDWNEGTLNYTYLHSTGSGQLAQVSGNQAIVIELSKWWEFTYTVSASTSVGALACFFPSEEMALNQLNLDVSSNGTRTVVFEGTEENNADFIIECTSDTGGDGFTLDDVTLKEVIGGNIIVAGKITGGGTGNSGLKLDGPGNATFDRTVTIDDSGAEAFMVRQSNDSGDVFTVNAATPGVIVGGDLEVNGTATPVLGSSLGIRSATAILAMTTGSSVTATNLIPAGSFVVGIVTRVNDLVTGPAGYDVGDGVDVDRWGNSILVAADTTSDITDFQSSALSLFPAANDVVITTDGVDFTAGNIRVIVYYMSLTAPTVD